MTIGLNSAILFSANAAALQVQEGMGYEGTKIHIFAGNFAGFIYGLVNTPIENIKIKMQIQLSKET